MNRAVISFYLAEWKWAILTFIIVLSVIFGVLAMKLNQATGDFVGATVVSSKPTGWLGMARTFIPPYSNQLRLESGGIVKAGSMESLVAGQYICLKTTIYKKSKRVVSYDVDTQNNCKP